MTHEEQIAHWNERALIAERALDDLYNRARDYAAPVGGGRIMIDHYTTAPGKIQLIKAIRDCTGRGINECVGIVNDLPQIVIDRSGRLAEALGDIEAAGHTIGWHHV